MDRKTPLPRRFQAETSPGDNLVTIFDTHTNRRGQIRLACYQSVASLMADLFGDEVDVAEREARIQNTTGMSIVEPSDADDVDLSTSPQKSDLVENVPESAPREEPTADSGFGAPEPTAEPEPPREEPAAPSLKPAAEEKPAPKKRGRPKGSKNKPKETSSSERETTKPSASKEKSPAASAECKPSPAATPAEVIQDNGFRMIRDPESDPVTYMIERDDGVQIGRLIMDAPKKVRVVPLEEGLFSESKHTSMIGAQARIEVVVEEMRFQKSISKVNSSSGSPHPHIV